MPIAIKRYLCIPIHIQYIRKILTYFYITYLTIELNFVFLFSYRTWRIKLLHLTSGWSKWVDRVVFVNVVWTKNSSQNAQLGLLWQTVWVTVDSNTHAEAFVLYSVCCSLAIIHPLVFVFYESAHTYWYQNIYFYVCNCLFYEFTFE